ncbi:hypothetical protein DN730_03850 [Marinomonas piezotolerans]|uniref:Uncharacterized protein n=1 Tax=Marinomonas piezotolerans TaxID=2213058 RepID=A0A370UEH4_9GAMM|nr:hypothetical protein [Marinomonas piezotolerans]RDL46180.1 hypothetical protein DN730_03850 [Marinomonas piezotolerans]
MKSVNFDPWKDSTANPSKVKVAHRDSDVPQLQYAIERSKVLVALTLVTTMSIVGVVAAYLGLEISLECIVAFVICAMSHIFICAYPNTNLSAKKLFGGYIGAILAMVVVFVSLKKGAQELGVNSVSQTLELLNLSGIVFALVLVTVVLKMGMKFSIALMKCKNMSGFIAIASIQAVLALFGGEDYFGVTFIFTAYAGVLIGIGERIGLYANKPKTVLTFRRGNKSNPDKEGNFHDECFDPYYSIHSHNMYHRDL